MPWPFHHRTLANYWLKAFGLYALAEACIQLLFNFILNSFRPSPISNIEFHGVMWFFQCLFIWPIWWMANAVYRRKVLTQVLVNLAFFFIYSYFWFEVVQDIIRWLHQALQVYTLPPDRRLVTPVDTPAYFDYQVLKHGFRLSWFFLANYFYLGKTLGPDYTAGLVSEAIQTYRYDENGAITYHYSQLMSGREFNEDGSLKRQVQTAQEIKPPGMEEISQKEYRYILQ